ncbi:LOW QUALITY PROTEIN: hypothetical protein ACHAWX_006849 [Stephanocyclus meneghinianus]
MGEYLPSHFILANVAEEQLITSKEMSKGKAYNTQSISWWAWHIWASQENASLLALWRHRRSKLFERHCTVTVFAVRGRDLEALRPYLVDRSKCLIDDEGGLLDREETKRKMMMHYSC